METEDKRKLRTAFMNWLFEVTGGSESEGMHAAGFKVPDGWTGAQPNENDVWDALKFLEGERLIRAHWPLGGLPTVMLTHRGIREMEKAIEEPKKRTEHFVPLINIMHVGTIVGSQISQGSPGAHQSGTFNVNQRESAESFVAAVRKILDENEVDPTVKRRTERDLTMMNDELAEAEPRWRILRTMAESVSDALVKAVGTSVAGELLSSWPI